MIFRSKAEQKWRKEQQKTSERKYIKNKLFLYNVASLQKMVGSPDSVQKNVVLENNSLSAEQITGVEKPKEQGRRSRSSRYCAVFRCFFSGCLACFCSADAACDCGGGGADHLPWTGGKETAATDAELARRFPAVEPGEYTRVCHLIEKHIYGEILLSPYEERTLNHFLEKLMEPVPGCSWKMRLKLRYACLRRVNTKKKKRKHSAFQQK